MKHNPRLLFVFWLAMILALIASSVAPASPTQAIALVVNSTNDVDDGACNGTHCSLREAINQANILLSDDMITFSVSGTIHLSSSLPQVINSGALVIDGGTAVKISGDSDNNGTRDVQPLYVFNSANLTLQNIWITKGINASGSGGAIINAGNLTLQNSVVSDSEASTPGFGGAGVLNLGGTSALTVTNSIFSGNIAYSGAGIYNQGGTVSILNSEFYTNTATDSGGGLYNTSGALNVLLSTFSNNTASNGGGGAIANNTFSGSANILASTFVDNQAQFGAGVYASQGLISIARSTFSSNDAASDAGGLYVTGTGSADLSSSTFSSNTTNNRGGAIFSFGPVTLTNVTFSDNTAPTGNGSVHLYNGALTIKNTIIANSGGGGDCVLSGTGLVAGGSSHNLLEDAANACGLTNGVNSNILGSDPKLGFLQDNGGPTETRALLVSSPAIDAGNDAVCPATDQRGEHRPRDVRCDIGAFEYDAPKIYLPLVIKSP